MIGPAVTDSQGHTTRLNGCVAYGERGAGAAGGAAAVTVAGSRYGR